MKGGGRGGHVKERVCVSEESEIVWCDSGVV